MPPVGLALSESAPPGTGRLQLYRPGRTQANNAIVALTGNPLGSMTVQCDITGGSTNFLFDVTGYFKYSP
jgi:hypothetical protein